MNKMVQGILNVPGMGAIFASHKLSALLGLMGISITLTDFPVWVRVLAGIIGLIILILVGLIKYEEWRNTRSDRLNSSDARDIKDELQDKADTIKGVDETDIKDAFQEVIHQN